MPAKSRSVSPALATMDEARAVGACLLLVSMSRPGRLAPILLDLLSMLTVYIWLGLECITSIYEENLNHDASGVFLHCLPLTGIQQGKSSSND